MNESFTAAPVQVTYMELRQAPSTPTTRTCAERVALERLTLADYLALYRRVGESLHWDQRLKMPKDELDELLRSGVLNIYVLRDAKHNALGLCEFDLSGVLNIELKNFGLIPEAYGRGLGPWLLTVAMDDTWRRFSPVRIWLHTDGWDHPAAIGVYERAGFHVYEIRQESPELL